MSAEEIRRLAESVSRHRADVIPCLSDETQAALLSYAAMVERCEAEIALTDKAHYTYERLNYILRGDAGKEER